MNKKIFLIAMSTLVFMSCLNEQPKNQLPEEKIYDNAQNVYINTVATLYAYFGGTNDSQGLQGTYRGVYDYNTFTTDEAMLPTRGGDWFDGGFWQSLYQHKWTPHDVALNNTWNYLFKIVTLCNCSLRNIEEHSELLTADQKSSYEAEVRAVRAMFYFYLVDMFGRVPVITSDKVPVNEIVQNKRSEVFSFAFNELQKVASMLPNKSNNTDGTYYGHVTRPVAFFLLAKLALNAEVYSDDDWTDGIRPNGSNIFFTVGGHRLNAWQTTMAYCDSITASGYRLASNYADNFKIHNETSPENILIIPMDKVLYPTLYKYLFRSRHYNHGAAIGFGAENGSCATVSTVETFAYGTDSLDARYNLNFFSDTLRVKGAVVRLNNGDALVYKPLEAKLDLTGSAYEKTAGARMKKYEIDLTAYNDGQLQDNDIVLFRYSDVLLMKSEAKMRNNTDGSAELNMVRARVGMPARQATFEDILDERLMELMWEGWRRQDLIRFDLFTSAYDQRTPLENEYTGYTTVFPIPANAIALNPLLTQNPGY